MRNHELSRKQFFEKGWCRFEYDAGITAWVNVVLPAARRAVTAAENAQWLRCGGTWFAGVNVLANRKDGSIDSGPPLQGEVIEFIREEIAPEYFAWDNGQVSVCYPGYPKPMASESEKAFQYRRNRDAAHVDGFLPEGPQRRRHLREFHGFILGIPLVDYDSMASPCVVWEGSHEHVRAAMRELFDGVEAADWGEQDITEAYHAVRHKIFEQCQRVHLSASPGEAYLIHRLALHGISPWQDGVAASADGRMICYFRPEISDAEGWLNRD